jgi:hypothetical protein
MRRAVMCWLITPVHFSYAALLLEQALPFLVSNTILVCDQARIVSKLVAWFILFSEVTCSARHLRRLNFLLT